MSTAIAARTAIRSPRAAAVAGIAFSVLLTVALALVRIAVPSDPKTVGDWLADGGRRKAVAVALNLLPFAEIAFLWFIGVVRDRIGEGEDRLFATVFLGTDCCSSPCCCPRPLSPVASCSPPTMRPSPRSSRPSGPTVTELRTPS